MKNIEVLSEKGPDRAPDREPKASEKLIGERVDTVNKTEKERTDGVAGMLEDMRATAETKLTAQEKLDAKLVAKNAINKRDENGNAVTAATAAWRQEALNKGADPLSYTAYRTLEGFKQETLANA